MISEFMNKIKHLLIALLVSFSFLNCEKDDICEAGTPTTPNLIIDFYDNNSPGAKKVVTDLRVIAEGEAKAIAFNPTLAETNPAKYLASGVSTIKIPLRTLANATKYSLTFNYMNIIPSLINEDKIEINYTHKDEFISRACGFKTLFELNSSNGITTEASSTDINKWIKEIVIQKYSILNENEVHVKIFH
jgi:Family of unknown function (DUF6452)